MYKYKIISGINYGLKFTYINIGKIQAMELLGAHHSYNLEEEYNAISLIFC